MRAVPRSGAMDSLIRFWSASGRIPRAPFVIGAVLVYGLIAVSHLLLSPAVTARIGAAPFAGVQAALTWIWYALHAKRRRDAGGGTGAVAGLAVIYALSIVLLLLLAEILSGVSMSGAATGERGGL